MLKVKNRNTRKMSVITSKLTIKTPERGQWCRSDVFIVNFEHITHLFLEFLLLTMDKKCFLGFQKDKNLLKENEVTRTTCYTLLY